MFKALIVEGDPGAGDVRSALADAGCAEVVTATYEDSLAILDAATGRPDLAVFHQIGKDFQRVQRLARSARELPLVVICDERFVDALLLAGATECVTTPVRPRELLGRIRAAVRDRAEARHQSHREQLMSETIVTLQREKEELERSACVDPLTGVANRRYTLSLLDAEWRRSMRDHAPLGVVMIDLDCYHAFNERYGHLGGDECLRLVSEAMSKCLRRPSDLLGRYGGEEFIALLPGTDEVGAKICAERLRATVEALGIPHEGSRCARVVTITAGFAAMRATADLALDKLIATADTALLRAKAAGRNRIEGDAPLVRSAREPAHPWERFEPVVADPWFADRIPACLADAQAGARTIVQALSVEDPRSILRTATPLLATARELGLNVLEKLVSDLERAASGEEITAAREAADAVIQYVTHVQVIYRRRSGGHSPLRRPLTLVR
ncbi:MAG: diguanylate cyclase [Deltaproteobacteria bacterium]|nr:diguanylate cyclase [Deltaproteobacteria bacterium]